MSLNFILEKHVSCPYSKEMPKILKVHEEKKTGNY